MEIEGWVKFILNSLYDGILIIDKNAVVQYVNDSYTRITGVTYDKIVGKYLREVRPGARLPDVLKTGKTLLRVPRKEGDVEYVVNMSPIKVKGEIVGGISVVTEITDAYKLTEELKKSHLTLEKLRNHVKHLYKAKYTFDDIISEDPVSKKVKQMAKKIAKTDSTVLIRGESGTGKELYAHAIHNESNRRNEPFIAVNCATLNSQLLESELFGYEEGTFTGAKKGGKVGLFEVADGGSIFLDEITEMDHNLQAKLLRTLQERTIRRVGGVSEKQIDVRIIAATNKPLEKLVKENKFREDLYYRIQVVPLTIPPLRDRKGDLKQLIEFFLEKIQRQLKKRINVSENAMKVLYKYDWPGNVRQLKNTLEFAPNMIEGYTIDTKHLPKTIQVQAIDNGDALLIKPLKETVKEKEIEEIKKAINIYGDTVEGKKKAAKALGISLATLYNKLD
ncbi:MAG: hypothetical protein PWQ82_1213 [Thermosediminibacterales bacterium]|nr:hypothetical protein [Thermosediminibacterales bacterium]MDK2836647.1 hypothetical protein [Thermosediminibacterales bacterium]